MQIQLTRPRLRPPTLEDLTEHHLDIIAGELRGYHTRGVVSNTLQLAKILEPKTGLRWRRELPLLAYGLSLVNEREFDSTGGHLLSACLVDPDGFPPINFFFQAVALGPLSLKATRVERGQFWVAEIDALRDLIGGGRGDTGGG